MADPRPTWQLVVEVARGLSARHNSFRLADIVESVQRLDPSRARTSIQPVVQGMTSNAGRGPQQPCGKVLLRTDHGWYRLLPAGFVDAPVERSVVRRRVPRTSTGEPRAAIDVGQRVREVVERFDELVEEYDRTVPFQRRGQYERHRATIDRRRELGSARAAIDNSAFTALLHETLQLWGIGRRASRLVPIEKFRERLAALADDIAALDALEIGNQLDEPSVEVALDRLIRVLAVVDNKSLIVAGTKALHHLLPDVVPPMDRRWTGAFFGWSPADPQTRQTAIFSEAYRSFVEIARATDPSRLVGAGWRTSTTKVLDNAIVAYCSVNGIKPRGQR
ncbi:MAG: hypothetical protein M3445_06905 [Actinomycetota bacterium]|nr:hypothetical protein [Actinomycetota bacterium]